MLLDDWAVCLNNAVHCVSAEGKDLLRIPVGWQQNHTSAAQPRKISGLGRTDAKSAACFMRQRIATD